MVRANNRYPGDRGFDSRRGLGIFLYPTLVTKKHFIFIVILFRCQTIFKTNIITLAFCYSLLSRYISQSLNKNFTGYASLTSQASFNLLLILTLNVSFFCERYRIWGFMITQKSEFDGSSVQTQQFDHY